MTWYSSNTILPFIFSIFSQITFLQRCLILVKMQGFVLFRHGWILHNIRRPFGLQLSTTSYHRFYVFCYAGRHGESEQLYYLAELLFNDIQCRDIFQIPAWSSCRAKYSLNLNGVVQLMAAEEAIDVQKAVV